MKKTINSTTSWSHPASVYFVRSGWLNLDKSALWGSGFNGGDWSRIAMTYSSPTSASAYYLHFYPSDVHPSDNYLRWQGYPVRCLVY